MEPPNALASTDAVPESQRVTIPTPMPFAAIAAALSDAKSDASSEGRPAKRSVGEYLIVNPRVLAERPLPLPRRG